MKEVLGLKSAEVLSCGTPHTSIVSAFPFLNELSDVGTGFSLRVSLLLLL